MLIAEIRRKLADLEKIDPEESDSVEKVRLMLRETSEDLLTADVFGAIKYLPRIPYLQKILHSIAEKNPQAEKYKNHINLLSEYIDTLKFVFWPSYPTPVGLPGSTTEPDLEISDTNILLFFEAKLHSGFGEFQIERELAVGLQQSKGREFFLVLVTAGMSPPRIRRQGQRLKMTDYIKSISSSSVVSKDITDLLKKNADRVLWISWQGIISALDKAFKNHTHMCELPPAEESRAPDILEDLTELMVMRGIQPLKGFSYIVERISDINIQGSFLPWIKPISTFAFRGFRWHTSPNLSILKPLNIKEELFRVTIKKPPFKGLWQPFQGDNIVRLQENNI